MSVYYNEIEQFACSVIENNIARGRLPAGFIDCRDICQVEPSGLMGYRQLHLFAGIGAAAYACRLAGIPDDFNIATLGFPCQNLSDAGKGEGMDGAQSGLFWEALRILAIVRPAWILIENVRGLRTKGDDIKAVELVIHGLEMCGYTVLPPIVVGADDVGAPQQRKRVWIVARANESLAHSDNLRRRSEPQNQLCAKGARNEPCGQSADVDNANGARSGDSIPARRDTSDCTSFTMVNTHSRECRASRQGEDQTESNSALSGTGEDVADSTGLAEFDVSRESGDFPESHHGPQGNDRQPCPCGSELADSNGAGRGKRRGAVSVPAQFTTVEHGGSELAHGDRDGCSGILRQAGCGENGAQQWENAHGQSVGDRRNNILRWPARPGEQQHEWEHPRTVKSPLGESVDGPARKLVRSTNSHRRNALKGLGNGWVPQTAVPILKWILAVDKEL